MRQERCARRDGWEMAKSIHKLKEKDKATFYSLSEVWSLPAPSSTKPEERGFVVDSGASLHMLSKKDLNLAELEVRVSRNPTTVITANGEVKTNEDATVYVYDLDLFVTVQIFEDTPAVLSLGKLCEDHGYSYDWASGQKPHLIENGRKTNCNSENYVPIGVPGLSTCSSTSTASASPASLPQDTTEDSTSSPATTRLRSTPAVHHWETVTVSYRNRKPKIKIRTPYRWMKECQHHGTHPQALLVNQIRNLQESGIG